MSYRNEYQLARLLSRKLLGLLTPAEEKQLEERLQESEVNRSLYNRLLQGKSFRQREELESAIELDRIVPRIEEKIRVSIRRQRIRRTASVAALLLVGMIVALLWPQTPESITPRPVTAELRPGSTKAILTLHNGRQKILTGTESAADVQRFLQSDTLSPAANPDTLYHKIEIPRGGEYRLDLADGTAVWLNAESIFEYPVQFAAHHRTVRLSGEAYFEVARDSTRPFEILTTDRLRIRVLGTSFNVHSYDDQPDILVTLVEGAVTIGRQQEETRLAPNQQAVYDRVRQQLTVREIPDARTYCSWKNGMFIYEGESLEVIMEALAKWYDVEIIYDRCDPKTLGHFSVNIDRCEHLTPILTMLRQITGLNYRIEGKQVRLSQP